MISIDQVAYYLDLNTIKRYDIKHLRKISRKDKYLYENRYITDKMFSDAFFLSKMTIIDE